MIDDGQLFPSFQGQTYSVANDFRLNGTILGGGGGSSKVTVNTTSSSSTPTGSAQSGSQWQSTAGWIGRPGDLAERPWERFPGQWTGSRELPNLPEG